jgi:1-acyl-sn-glycerol-3-phosphate acyltransferase
MAYTRGANIINFAPEFPPFTIVFQFVLALVRLIDWLYYRIRITGRENLRAAGAAVLVSNHTLLLDPGIIAHAVSPHRTYFTMLEDTALVPFLGTFVRLLGAIPIPESSGALRTLDAAARVALSRLGFIHFFPEGECYRGAQDLHPFHPGAFLLACRLRVPIVPVATVLHEQRWLGRSSFHLFGRTLRVPPRVSIIVGSPVQPPTDLDAPLNAQGSGFALKRAARALSRQVQESMQSMIDRAGGSRSFYRGVMPRLVKHDEARTLQGAARVG